MKKTGIFLITICCFSFIYSQSLKQKVADSYYEKLAYVKAIKLYEDIADNENKVNPHSIRRVAECYNHINEFDKSAHWYRILYENGDATLDDKYQYMLILRKIKSYDESLEILKDYYESGGDDRFVRLIIQNPDYLNKIYNQNNEDLYSVRNEEKINSKENDFSPTFYKDGILFASARSKTNPIEKRIFAWDETTFLDLFYAERQGDDVPLDKFKKIDVEGSEKFHDGPATVDPSNPNIIYLTRSHFKDKNRIKKSNEGTVEVNLYIAQDDNDNKFHSPVPFPTTSSEYSTGNATVSADANYMVFSSDRPGTMGQSDLWLLKKTDDNSWGAPLLLGNHINTQGRENFPFLAKNGDLYFSSDRLPGLGGYDVFRVPNFLNGGKEVQNLGSPINSKDDDIGFIVNENGYGYFSSNRDLGIGKDDIYSFHQKYSSLNVCVVDKQTGKIIEDASVLINLPIGDNIKKLGTSEEGCTGYQNLSPSEYVITASKENYDAAQEQKRIALELGKTETVTIELDKKIKKPCPKVILEDIYYDFDKYFIRNDASKSLNELLNFLKQEPNVKILLVSHTDSRGSHQYNDWLSQKRAESCVNYLIDRGINANRLTPQGRGERQLLNRCSNGIPCSDREHQANRRTEVIILYDDCYEIEKVPNKYLK